MREFPWWVCHKESALVGVRSDVSSMKEEYRKPVPILAHGVNSVSGLALVFGHGSALDLVQTICNLETDSGNANCASH